MYSPCLFTVLIRENCLTITLNTNGYPPGPIFTEPLYSITITAIERQHMPAPRLTIDENSEVWVEDGYKYLRRIVVGACQGQVKGHFFFACWGCEGARDEPLDHETCAYGVLRVEHKLLHPVFNRASFPEHAFFSFDMDEAWKNIPPQLHLQLAFVYPPGLASDITTWYDYILPIPVFTTEREALQTTQTKARKGFIRLGDGDRRRILDDESRQNRRIAHLTRNLAKDLAELCKAAHTMRTYRRLLTFRGMHTKEGENRREVIED